MSEARKKLEKEWKDQFKKTAAAVPYLLTPQDKQTLENIKREEEQTKEEIKHKKEELRLKREEQLTMFKHDIRVMIDDEEKGIKYYEGLIIKANALGLTDPASPIVFNLNSILGEERRHLNLLKEMMNWRSVSTSKSTPTYLPSGRPIPRRILQT